MSWLLLLPVLLLQSCHLAVDAAFACKDYMAAGHTASGVYEINPGDGGGTFNVYCDMVTNNKSWIVFQRRLDGSVDFDRNWADYKNGFGDLDGEFWLGLDKISRLSSADYSDLRISMTTWQGAVGHASYSTFRVKNETYLYEMRAGGYSGNAGNELLRNETRGAASGMQFTTKDSDHDKLSDENCAQSWKGGWWFNGCFWGFPNGIYGNANSKGWEHIIWADFTSDLPRSMRYFEMKLTLK